MTIPSDRVSFPVVDRAVLDSMIDSLYRQLEHQQEMSSRYNLLQETLRDQVARGDRLDQQIKDLYASASHFVVYVQRKYDLLRHQCETAVVQSSEYRDELSRRHDQSQEILDLRSLLSQETTDRICDQENFEKQLDTLQQKIVFVA